MEIAFPAWYLLSRLCFLCCIVFSLLSTPFLPSSLPPSLPRRNVGETFHRRKFAKPDRQRQVDRGSWTVHASSPLRYFFLRDFVLVVLVVAAVCPNQEFAAVAASPESRWCIMMQGCIQAVEITISFPFCFGWAVHASSLLCCVSCVMLLLWLLLFLPTQLSRVGGVAGRRSVADVGFKSGVGGSCECMYECIESQNRQLPPT